MSENASSDATSHETSGAARLELAEQAHRSGHFAQVRAIVQQLEREGGLGGRSGAGEKRLRALRDRLRPDPFVALLIAACLALFIVVVWSHWR